MDMKKVYNKRCLDPDPNPCCFRSELGPGVGGPGGGPCLQPHHPLPRPTPLRLRDLHPHHSSHTKHTMEHYSSRSVGVIIYRTSLHTVYRGT